MKSLDIKNVFALYEEHVRKNPTVPQGFERVIHPQIVKVCGPTGAVQDNWVSYSELSEADVAETIEATIHFYQHRGHDFEWKWYDTDTPSTLKTHLLQAGFQEESPEVLMVLDVRQSLQDSSVSAFDIQQVTDEAQFADLLQVQNAVWNEDLRLSMNSLRREQEENPDHLKIYQAYDGNTAVANAWMRFEASGHFAYLFGGSTLPAYRRQGLYRQLVLHRAYEAQQRGAWFLCVDAGPMSEPLLRKMGFVTIATTTPLIWKTQDYE